MIARYARLFRVQLRTSVLLAMQYRADFLLDGALELFWAATVVVPLFVVFRSRTSVAGWTFGEALLVIGWFHLLQGVIEGAINPSLNSVVEHVRKGTLDFVLIKPADALFLVSTARFEIWRATHAVTASVIFAWAFRLIGRPPSPFGVIGALALLGCSVVLLYSFWILTVSAAFYVVRIDNLTYLFSSIFDAARWPATVFRGVVRFVFTFVLPIAIMTTFPAQALLGTISAQATVGAFVAAIAFATLARVVWNRSIGRYTSAGG